MKTVPKGKKPDTGCHSPKEPMAVESGSVPNEGMLTSQQSGSPEEGPGREAGKCFWGC